MLQKAESYVPAIVYAHAGIAISKHAAVAIAADGLVYPAQGTDNETFLGIAMAGVSADEPVLVQTDGVCYGWEGIPQLLLPGTVYYAAANGELSGTGYSRVGIAIDETTLVFSSGTTTSGPPVSGGSAPEVTNTVYEYIQLISAPLTIEGRIAATWTPLKTPVLSPADIYEIRLIGCGTLIPGVDYVITTTPPSPTIGTHPPSTVLPVGGGGSVVYDTINFDPNLLMFTAPAGEHSVLPRMRLGDRLLIVRKEHP